MPKRMKHRRTNQEDTHAAQDYLQRMPYPAARRMRASEVAAPIATDTTTTDTATMPSASARLFTLSWCIALFLAILLSGLWVVYSKDLSRRLFLNLGQLRQQQHQLQVDWGRLLLERATLSTPSRIQQLALGMGMVLPSKSNMQMLAWPSRKAYDVSYGTRAVDNSMSYTLQSLAAQATLQARFAARAKANPDT